MKEKIQIQKIDMLHGSIWDKLLFYAVPVAATGILEQLFNASDIAIVGNFANENRTAAVAAVGANSPIIGLILNLFIGIALGTNVVIANAIGEKNEKTISKVVNTSIIMAVIGGVLVALIGELVIGNLLQSLSVPTDVFPYALLYMRIYLLGMPSILLYNFEAAIFRSIGDTKVPLKALTVSGILNVILNLFFVIVLKMNVNGVAIATVISNIISSIILFIKLTKSYKSIHLNLKNIQFDRESFIKILKIGLPTGIQSVVFSIANIVIQSAINSLGTIVIAASSAAFNIEIFAYYVLNSFSQACTTFVGQNYGARQMKRCGIPRKDLFITTKLWITDTNSERAKIGFEKSLSRLGLDYIYLYLVHQPYNDYSGAWKALEELYADGKVKSIGVDNFTQDRLADFIFFNKIKPAVNMIECNTFFQRENELQYLKEQNVIMQAWAPLASGHSSLFINLNVYKKITPHILTV